jgi:hypothetical protein
VDFSLRDPFCGLYVDDGVVECQTAGGDVDWDIRRARSLGELRNESLGAAMD